MNVSRFQVGSNDPAVSILLDQLSPPPKTPIFACPALAPSGCGDEFTRISNAVRNMVSD